MNSRQGHDHLRSHLRARPPLRGLVRVGRRFRAAGEGGDGPLSGLRRRERRARAVGQGARRSRDGRRAALRPRSPKRKPSRAFPTSSSASCARSCATRKTSAAVFRKRRARSTTRKSRRVRSAARRRRTMPTRCARKASISRRCRRSSRAITTDAHRPGPRVIRGLRRSPPSGYNAPAPGGPLAQLVEQRTFNPLVAGSNPARPTIARNGHGKVHRPAEHAAGRVRKSDPRAGCRAMPREAWYRRRIGTARFMVIIAASGR